MLTVRFRATDGRGTLTLQDSQPCRLLRFQDVNTVAVCLFRFNTDLDFFATASDFSYRSVRLGYLALNNPNILRRLIVRNQSANALQQPGISVAALQRRHFS